MIKNTIASVSIIKRELSFFSFLANLISSIIMIGYLIFSMIMGRGVMGVNISLVALTVFNLAVYLITNSQEDKSAKKLRRRVKHFYRISKIVLNAIPLATVLYILAFTGEEIPRLETVLLPLMIIMWLVQLSLEVATLYIRSRITLFTDAIRLDFEEAVRPLTRAKNAILGSDEEESESEGVSKRNRRILSEKVAEAEREKAERRAENGEPMTAKEKVLSTVTKTTEKIKELMKK